ncbi:lactate utilization protein C [Euzebya sp.]|uniref:LutC/YkgG family protein n=1 Tax=Euzebya sp. TaxID=1971409 RepID=UPI0035189B32
MVDGARGAHGEARQVVLDRIRAALDGQPPPAEIPRGYAVDHPALGDQAAVLDRFVDRVTDYRADLTRTGVDGIAAAVAAALGDARSVVVPPDLDGTWLPDHVDSRPDHQLPVADLDAVEAVITAAAVGIAETGTVVLDAGPGQGRRAISLVPDLHVCVIRADQVVATVPQAVRRLDPTRPQTWISGPSATSDIELDRVEGVHGPRTLHVVLVD